MAQLRDVPRAIIGDPAEVVHFLGRTARALERLRDTPVPVSKPASSVPAPLQQQVAQPVPVRALSARERAEAVFRPASSPHVVVMTPTTASPVDFHGHHDHGSVVISRRGRPVRVEVRRARAAGQLEMPL